MTVENLATDTSTQVDPAVVANGADAMPSDDSAVMNEVWDRLHPQERVDRSEDGKFASKDQGTETPLEGGEGGEPAASTVADVPLPANWVGKEALWAKLPADTKAEIAEHQKDQHARLSDMGRKVAAYEPLNNVGADIAAYLQSAAEKQGEAYSGPRTAAEGISYLFNIQRSMDRDPVNTVLSIIDTYGAREKIAAALGVKAGDAPGDGTQALLAEIGSLKSQLASLNDPSRIEQVLDRRESKRQHEEEVSRLAGAKPLYAEIPEDDMVFYINKAWKQLGQDATKQQVFDHAYNAAIEASPTLRAKAQAASDAAKDAAAKAEGAKRGASVNVKSAATDKARKLSDEELMEDVWRKHNPER